MVDLIADVKRVMRDVPDFPRDGVLFKDMTPVLQDPSLFRRVVAWMGEGVGTVDKVVGIESRGFIFAAPMVDTLDAGLVLARKKGKLPWRTVSRDYELEYGSATLEIHADAIAPGERVLVVDDLLATGGTARATIDLVRELGGVVTELVVLSELTFLDGRKRIDCPVRALVSF
ncbi:MAG: adenine phosphoribosyltransferase [Alphaproteobacteria bacterium]|nr:adenine phosphoribosyltransferase [Alphaproteobacteria bacterium]MCB9690358.1 adenine phosphoribosyltransferase [Alphaproteobacteria bacterium]